MLWVYWRCLKYSILYYIEVRGFIESNYEYSIAILETLLKRKRFYTCDKSFARLLPKYETNFNNQRRFSSEEHTGLYPMFSAASY